MLEDFWEDLVSLDDRTQLPAYVRKRIHPVWPDQQITAEDLTARIMTLLTLLDDETGDLRPNEHLMLCSGGRDDEDFPEFSDQAPKPPAGDGGLAGPLGIGRTAARSARAERIYSP